jgi:hypothetical protein
LNSEQYNCFRVSPLDPATLRCEGIEACLKKLADAAPDRLIVSRFADSFENRPIHLVTLGNGPRRVLLWSQMHGDEPTHTAVLLDLISYLARFPQKSPAAEILAGCTLLMLPMLNPDGAERGTRNNAQDIDVNRDARRLATPEGRALQRAVETLKPQFGFNLHNQHARTTVGKPAKPAVASVLAPPLDVECTETEQVRYAKQIASCFVEAIRPQAEGMVSRYDADYMPRCFGESIQGHGVTTVLIEAGGWPAADPTPLVELHFHGLLAALRAIATDRYREVEGNIYDSLPRSNEFAMCDCLIQSGHVFDAHCSAPFLADLGINHAQGHRLVLGKQPDGRIAEIGDVSITTGKITINACNCLVLPGRIAFWPNLVPGAPLEPLVLDSLLSSGTTTLVACVDLVDCPTLDAIGSVNGLPVNIGYVAALEKANQLPTADLIDLLLFAVSQGILAVIGDAREEAVRRYLDWFGVPTISTDRVPAPQSSAHSFLELAREIEHTHKMLSLQSDRSRIQRNAFADFQFFNLGDPVRIDDPIDGGRLTRVMVAGETVWENGRRTGQTPGMLLRRRVTDMPK